MTGVDIEYLKALAEEAGQRALEMVASMRPELKADGSYVTEIDRHVEQLVRGRLAEKYPDYAFLGEEFGMHGDREAPLWAVDPIDGTTNLVFGIPMWCVSIGLVVRGEPVAGVIYAPRTQELFWAERGQGAFCNGYAMQASAGSSLHAEDTLGFTSAAIKNLDTRALTGRLRCLGSIALDIAYAARGTLRCLIGWSEGAYDMAAALCMAREAGCVAEYLDGRPLDLGELLQTGKTREPFVVAHPQLAGALKQLVSKRAETPVP